MTCKDCVHYEVCEYWSKEAYKEQYEFWDYQICKDFLNKATHLEVPCAIGQSMWRLLSWYRAPAEIIESKVSMIQQKADKTWKFRISNRYGTSDFATDDIGKEVFYTKEEAEAALNAVNSKNEEVID